MRSSTDLDPQDIAILQALKKNARISNKDLAEMVGLAPSTCLERVRRLREMGAIRGYHAHIDLALDAFTTRPEVAHIETRLIFEHLETHRLPIATRDGR